MKYIFLYLFITAVHSFKRLLTFEKTPGCSNCSLPVFYIRAQGPNDTLHYLWDFTTKPTLLVALTEPYATINFNWSDFKMGKKSVGFDPSPDYTFALVFNKLIEFNDVRDAGFFTSNTENVSYDTRQFFWQSVGNDNGSVSDDFVGLNIKGLSRPNAMTPLNGTIYMQLAAFGAEGHDTLQPRLMHSANSSQCRIILDKLHSESGFNSSRYAFDLIIVSSDLKISTSKIISRMNFDDENSPGVFSVVDFMTPKSQDHLYKGVFMQWRPIAFIDEIPSLVNSTEVIAYNVTNFNKTDDPLQETLVYKYYGPDYEDNLIQQTAISIGLAEDGFYKKTNYSSWTFTVNYGSPETEKFSLLVILVMAIGLGFPIVLLFIGVSYMIARRCRNKNELNLTR